MEVIVQEAQPQRRYVTNTSVQVIVISCEMMTVIKLIILEVIDFWILRVFVSVELFGGSYYVTAMNYLCTDKDKVPIEDIQDCKEAAQTIPYVRFYENFINDNSQRYPTGCYINGKGVYFNTHTNGSRQEKSGSICRSIGK